MIKAVTKLSDRIGSLTIPQISRMSVNFLPKLEPSVANSPVTVKFLTHENYVMLKASTTNTNPLLSMQLDHLVPSPRNTCSVVVPEQSFWNDNFGSVYRNRLLLVYMGKEKDVDMNVTIRKCVNTATNSLLELKQTQAVMEIPSIPSLRTDEIAMNMADIIVCSNHAVHDGKYISVEDKKKQYLSQVDLTPSKMDETVSNDEIAQAIKYGALLGEGTVNARMWANEQASVMNPRELELLCRQICDSHKMEINVLQSPHLQEMHLNMIEAVGSGSSYPPRLIIMTYIGDKSKLKFTALVGKGVCFDSGGLNLKPTGSIEDMQLDMGGAAAVLGTIDVLAKMHAPVNVVAAIPAVENMIGNSAYKPGSILKSYNGRFVEVCNTDAEGRLILADAMSFVQQRYEVESMVDICTLTGAICVALGECTAGLYSNNDELANEIMEAGKAVRERCWRMPIEEEHLAEIRSSSVADLRSMGEGRYGGACTAAAFLSEFVEKGMPAAHLDIAGTGMYSKSIDWVPKGGTGFGVQLLTEWLMRRYTKK